MIESPIPHDITKYKSKFVGNFTAREAVCIMIAAVCGLFTFNITKSVKGMDATVRVVLIGLSATPALLAGFMKIFGMPVEKVIVPIVVDNFLKPLNRKKEVHYPEFEKYEKTRKWMLKDFAGQGEEENPPGGKKKKPAKSGTQKAPEKIKIQSSKQFKGIK